MGNFICLSAGVFPAPRQPHARGNVSNIQSAAEKCLQKKNKKKHFSNPHFFHRKYGMHCTFPAGKCGRNSSNAAGRALREVVGVESEILK